MTFDERVDLFIQEHRELMKDGDFLSGRLEEETPAAVLPHLLEFFDTSVMIHSDAEERELPPLAEREGRNYDPEAVHFAHEILLDDAGALRERLGDHRVTDDVLKREMVHFLQLIHDHFLEEETHLYLTTQEEIDALKGSY